MNERIFETITAAAILGKDGKTIFSLPIPARHHTILQQFYPNVSKEPKDQGFLTSENRWVNRWQAKRIAMRARQPFREGVVNLDEHYSENLW